MELKAYPSHISLQIMMVEPYIYEMTDNSVYIDEITSQHAYLPSYVSELGRSVDSDANLSIARRLFSTLVCGGLEEMVEPASCTRGEAQSQSMP